MGVDDSLRACVRASIGRRQSSDDDVDFGDHRRVNLLKDRRRRGGTEKGDLVGESTGVTSVKTG